ncbi:MAG: Vi polysaccharide biosynthesis protein VipA/TviB [Candidatus Wallbacteria bacterium GWC2_49_35]|uniref:Vi polysaccharide biosynthesis protein VipA/TviB n=1 Tax=Candidatus Wallbacteria bacterium GWC2_49_35 TaxID=1817813 RepID=A0A1F7WQR4_9BACT|nr:MAG: Vi polysaccharide biosynthesis protein VipA/TviB [Candidatus Wallbacteria bacterium GWC2_49_35]
MKIGVIGLGYVGLPLAVEFGKVYGVTGFDISESRVAELKKGVDRTLEVDAANLESSVLLKFTTRSADLADCNYYIVTVPTPVNEHKIPDLGPLLKACETVGRVLSKGDIVIFESTVYPGATEEDCVPVLEKSSGLKFNRDFYCGYSPERINPGDKRHTLVKIKKVTSGSTPAAAEKVDALYRSIIVAGTHLAPSIKVAEAAKVIENSQRDINIAFINELAKIFHKMNIDTGDVLAAAATKWNFLPFRPGLVGGHCIGVDPYYLTYKAQSLGYIPEIILAGRRLNDNMGGYVAGHIIKLMIKKGILINKSKVLVLGVTFKENCPDIRNSRVVDIINELKEFGADMDVYDPWARSDEVRAEYKISMIKDIRNRKYDAIVLAVAHDAFRSIDIASLKKKKSVVYDVKGFFEFATDGRL